MAHRSTRREIFAPTTELLPGTVTVSGQVVYVRVWRMPMRSDCKHFETRSYPTGDTVRKCNLDLAPEAPWRCPDACAGFAPRLADVSWQRGTLVVPPTPPEPENLGDGSIAALLDEVEDIVNAATPAALAEAAKRPRSGDRSGASCEVRV